MKTSIRSGLLAALSLACCYSGWAESGATDRSNAFGYQFTLAELDSFPQKTNLPTVYLQIYKTNYDSETDATSFTLDENGNAQLEDIDNIFKDGNKFEWYYKTKITIRDDYGSIKERNEWLGVRGRGNSTWYLGWGMKKPLRLKFPNKTDLLTRKENGVEVNDFATEKNWTLLANRYDASLIRNALAYELENRMGMTFCPAYKFVDMVVNGEYMGTYQFSDHVQIADRRVPINKKTGYLLEANRQDNRFQEDPYLSIPFSVDNYGYQLLVNVKNPDPDISTESGPTVDTKYNDIKNKLSMVINLLCNPPADGKDNWRKHVDFTSAVDALVAMEIMGNYDGAVGNNYAYLADIDSKIVFGPLWDIDLAWNYNINGENTKGKHFWEYQYMTPFGALCSLAYKDPYFVKAVYKRWKGLCADGLEDFLKTKVQELSAYIRQSAELNYLEKSNGGAGCSYSSSWADSNNYTSIDNIYEVMNAFVTDRISDLDDMFTKQYEALGCASLECTEHDYDNCTFAMQDDGSYRRVCNICAEAETDGEAYYYFTVYPESDVTESLYATSWEPSNEHPNSIAVVNVTPGTKISGYNIVNATKDEAGNKTCADFRLEDGHPFFCDDKFVATKATYSRSVSNTWGTMILPFKYQQAETETAKFFHLAQQTTDDQGTLTLVMTPIDPSIDGNASAYTPVVFMRSNDEVNIVTVKGENITVKKSSADKTKETLSGWTLTGVMEKTVFDDVKTDAENDYYYISNNQFLHATRKLTTNPFRAYLTTAKSTNGARSIRLATGDEPSGVKSMDANECLALFVAEGQLTVIAPKQMDISVSNLGGAVVCRQRVQAGERLSLLLAKGVYVVNGVKVMVK